MKEYVDTYLRETASIIERLDRESLVKAIALFQRVKAEQGRLFILGVGGSAANASHAVNDFRKIAGMEAYAPSDNVAELTAWTNDKGFEYVFVEWLKTSRLRATDAIVVFSVGGGTETTSKNLVLAMRHAKDVGAKIVSVVSRDGGAALTLSDVCILVPVIASERITPHAEGWQMVLSHLIVNAMR
jgi:D-sedoheptulose 7-phosphate isomerase